MWGSVWFGGGEVYCPLIAERSCSASACSANEDFGAPNWGASADEAHELLFDDHSGHALHFGEAAGQAGGGLVQRDDFLNGFSRQFLSGRGEKFFCFLLVARVQIPTERAEQGADPRAAPVQAWQSQYRC